MTDFVTHVDKLPKNNVLSGLLHGNVKVLILTINKLPLIDAMHGWCVPGTWFYTGELPRSKLRGPFHAVGHTVPMHIEAWPGVHIWWCHLTMDRLITKMVRWCNWQGLQVWVSLWLLCVDSIEGPYQVCVHGEVYRSEHRR